MGIYRLDKYLADMKIGTRSQVKEYVKKGRVSVNGENTIKADMKVDTDSDKVLFDGKPVDYVEMEYYMLNKPAGVLTATTDKKMMTVIDLIDSVRKDLFPVGRLDKDTEGLLLITNDGELAHNLLSPKKHVDKKYFARVRNEVNADIIKAFENGLKVDEKFTAMPAKLELIKSFPKDNEIVSEVYVTLREGKFHQIKRMFEAVDSEVLYLKRITMGQITLDDNLKPGESRPLTEKEISELKVSL